MIIIPCDCCGKATSVVYVTHKQNTAPPSESRTHFCATCYMETYHIKKVK